MIPKRWIPVIVFTAALIAVNVAARIVVAVSTDSDDEDLQFTIGLYGTIAMFAVALVAGVWWATRKPVQEMVSEMGLAISIATATAVFLAPLTVGESPFSGFGWIVIQVLFFFGIGVIGGFTGLLGAVLFGRDYAGKTLRAAERHFGRRRPARKR